MNNSQTTAGTDASQYGTTRNPQTPAGQSLSSTATNLQTSNPNLFTGNNNVSITSVGDTSFTPFTSDNTSQASIEVAPAKVTNYHYPVIIGSGLLVVVVVVVSWLIIRRQSAY